VIEGLLHSTVSPEKTKVPLVEGVVDQVTLSLLTVELARGSTMAYRFPADAIWISCPPVIWNCAAFAGSPRTASEAVPKTSD